MKALSKCNYTLTAWIQEWLKLSDGSIEPSTAAQYRNCLNRYIMPFFGSMPLVTITEDDIQDFYNVLGHNGKGLSAQTIHIVKAVLHQALDYAVSSNILIYNPADLAYSLNRTYNRPAILSSCIIRFILNKEFHNAYENFFPILLLAALRYGECAGLTWDAVDLPNRIIQIQQQLVEYDMDGHTVRRIQLYTKNHQCRTLLLPETAVQYFEAQRHKQNQYQNMYGEHWYNPNHLVYTNPDGSMLQHYKVNRRFKKMVSFLGMPEASMHSLRHTGCSILYHTTGDISLLKAYTGHSSDGAASYYIHSLDTMRQEAE